MSFNKIKKEDLKDKEVKFKPEKYYGYIKSVNSAKHIVECPLCNNEVISFSEKKQFNGLIWAFCDYCRIRINL